MTFASSPDSRPGAPQFPLIRSNHRKCRSERTTDVETKAFKCLTSTTLFPPRVLDHPQDLKDGAQGALHQRLTSCEPLVRDAEPGLPGRYCTAATATSTATSAAAAPTTTTLPLPLPRVAMLGKQSATVISWSLQASGQAFVNDIVFCHVLSCHWLR